MRNCMILIKRLAILEPSFSRGRVKKTQEVRKGTARNFKQVSNIVPKNIGPIRKLELI